MSQADAAAEEALRSGLFQSLDTVFLAAPTSSDNRLRLISKVSSGFLYLIARTGVTGEQTEIDESLRASVHRVRTFTNLPVAVGFGIRSGRDVEKVWQYADAAVVGSAIVKFIDENKSSAGLPAKVAAYVRDHLLPVI